MERSGSNFKRRTARDGSADVVYSHAQGGLRMLRHILLGCALAMPSIAIAQAPQPCEGEPYSDFDFWLGEWDVAMPDGQHAGVNRITKEEGGCLVVERWEGASGGTGQSYNYYDTRAKAWRQVRVSGAFTIDYSGGLDSKGRMALEGEIAYRDGRTAPFRGVWDAREDGTVEQVFTQRDAESGDWQPWFTGIYTRRETTPSQD